MNVICLMGPTAVGKTRLAIELTQKEHFAIISVDSGMVYRGMDIGTAKPTREELAIAPHLLIDICDPSESYSAGRFCNDAKNAIETIIASGRTPLLVGGTMLYFRALQQGLSELPEADPILRAKLATEIIEHGIEKLYAKLQKIDPKSAERISKSDKQRISRALEVYELTGKTLSAIIAEDKNTAPEYSFVNLAILPDQKSDLDKIIEQRFDAMLKNGFLEEVEKLYNRSDLNPDLPSMRTVGYRQAWKYLADEIDYKSMREKSIIATRQLAKRQMTWLRSWPGLLIIRHDDIIPMLTKNPQFAV